MSDLLSDIGFILPGHGPKKAFRVNRTFNWLPGFSAPEFAYKRQQERVFADTSEPASVLFYC